MKSNETNDQSPILSKSKQSLFNYDDWDNEDDSKYSDNSHGITFNVPPRDPKSFAKKERIKESFQSIAAGPMGESTGLCGYSVFEEGEIPTGCGMRLVGYLDSLDQQYIDQMEDEEYLDYDDCYVWLTDTSKLYYIKDRHIEAVNVSDLDEFQKSLTKFMQDEYTRYTTKRMTYDDVYEVITQYSHHMPKQMESALHKDSEFTFGVLEILKKNARPLKTHRVAWIDEEHDVIHFYASDSEDEQVESPRMSRP